MPNSSYILDVQHEVIYGTPGLWNRVFGPLDVCDLCEECCDSIGFSDFRLFSLLCDAIEFSGDVVFGMICVESTSDILSILNRIPSSISRNMHRKHFTSGMDWSGTQRRFACPLLPFVRNHSFFFWYKFQIVCRSFTVTRKPSQPVSFLATFTFKGNQGRST